MYKQIENEFVNGSKERKNKILFVVLTLIIASITSVPLVKVDAPIWSFLVAGVGEAILLLIISYFYMFFSLGKDQRKELGFFKILSVLAIYQSKVHAKDLILLINIAVKHDINTTEKIKEAIRHYQNLLPRKVISGGTWLSICALSVSIAAFISVENQTSVTAHLEVLVVVLVALTVIYFACKVIGEEWFQIFGKHAMYERLEAALSELYFMATTDTNADDKGNSTEQNE